MILISLQFSACNNRVTEELTDKKPDKEENNKPLVIRRNTVFPQIHTNLDGMVSEFVRTLYQDKRGNYWFGSNGDGIIRYNGQSLEKMTINASHQGLSVREIVEDNAGNVWFGTSGGLIKYDGKNFTVYAEQEGLDDEEVWGLTIDSEGLFWVGTIKGVFHFDGKKFTPFILPDSKVENPQHMLSDKMVFKFLEDRDGTMWLVTDGNGIFKYRDGKFIHLTKKNGLTDNNPADIFKDSRGNIWIGTYYGGVSKFDGKKYTNFTQDGIIEGIETYNFCEDRHGNIWFAAEHFGVYKYDGSNFTQFTKENGLATNGIQSILADNKGQLWFSTWQGITLYDGQKFMNAKEKEPWTE